MSFFPGGGGSAGISSRIQCLERWYFFTDSGFGSGKLWPFFEGGGGSVALVFLHGFSVWEGKTVSFFFFFGGGGAGISLENETMVILQEGGSTKAT